MALDVEPVLQAQRLERVFAQLALQKALGLAPELGRPFLDQKSVDRVVPIHRKLPEIAEIIALRYAFSRARARPYGLMVTLASDCGFA